MVARHANLAGMRHAACGMRKTAHGKAATKRQRQGERESSNGTGSPQETTILRSLLYFTIFASRISCSHTHRHTLTCTRIHSSVCLAACSWAAELAACGIALAVKADNTPGYCANSTASYLLNSGYNFSATSGLVVSCSVAACKFMSIKRHKNGSGKCVVQKGRR